MREELKGCTFAPKINCNRPQHKITREQSELFYKRNMQWAAGITKKKEVNTPITKIVYKPKKVLNEEKTIEERIKYAVE